MPRMILRWLTAMVLAAGGVLLQPVSASARHEGHGGGHGGHPSFYDPGYGCSACADAYPQYRGVDEPIAGPDDQLVTDGAP
jgi:hypothetical protein